MHILYCSESLESFCSKMASGNITSDDDEKLVFSTSNKGAKKLLWRGFEFTVEKMKKDSVYYRLVC